MKRKVKKRHSICQKRLGYKTIIDNNLPIPTWDYDN